MTSQKCPNCAMVNFASSESCRRCKAALKAAPASPQPTPVASPPAPKPDVYETTDAKSRWSFSPLKVLLIILLIAVPCWFYYRSQEEARVDEQQQLKKWEENNPVLKANKRNELLQGMRQLR